MAERLRPRDLLLKCKELLEYVADGNTRDLDSDEAWDLAARLALCFSKEDEPGNVWEQAFGRDVKVVVRCGQTNGDLVTAGRSSMYPKQAREMAAELRKAAAWNEAFDAGINAFSWPYRHSAALRTAIRGMTSVQIRAWAKES